MKVTHSQILTRSKELEDNYDEVYKEELLLEITKEKELTQDIKHRCYFLFFNKTYEELNEELFKDFANKYIEEEYVKDIFVGIIQSFTFKDKQDWAYEEAYNELVNAENALSY